MFILIIYLINITLFVAKLYMWRYLLPHSQRGANRMAARDAETAVARDQARRVSRECHNAAQWGE